MGKGKKASRPNQRVVKRRRKWPILLICLVVVVLVAAALYSFKNRPSTRETATISIGKEAPDFGKLLGSWVRPDGGYVIEIKRIHPDGRVDTAYLNPRPIHVSRSRVSEKDGTIELFIELQDQGYPGSTYTLRHNPEYDVMVGVYFQAAVRQSFDVVFQRK